jgi:hypothetical protein
MESVIVVMALVSIGGRRGVVAADGRRTSDDELLIGEGRGVTKWPCLWIVLQDCGRIASRDEYKRFSVKMVRLEIQEMSSMKLKRDLIRADRCGDLQV